MIGSLIGRLVAGALAGTLIAGCASRQVAAQRDEETSLVVVHFDLRRSPRSWNQVPIRCKERDGQMSWWHMRSDGDGMYYQENVPIGSCWILGGFNGGNAVYVFKLLDDPEQNPTTVRVTRPGVHFMGSFRYEARGGDEFVLVRADSPRERELFKRLLPYTAGTAWEGLVKRRLKTP